MGVSIKLSSLFALCDNCDQLCRKPTVYRYETILPPYERLPYYEYHCKNCDHRFGLSESEQATEMQSIRKKQ